MAAPSDLSLAVTQVPPVLTVTQVAPDGQRANICRARPDTSRLSHLTSVNGGWKSAGKP